MTGFIIYFTLLSIAHLFFCYFGMHTPRKLTKPLLLLSLAACYACAAKPVDGAVLAALICGLAGDSLYRAHLALRLGMGCMRLAYSAAPRE